MNTSSCKFACFKNNSLHSRNDQQRISDDVKIPVDISHWETAGASFLIARNKHDNGEYKKPGCQEGREVKASETCRRTE